MKQAQASGKVAFESSSSIGRRSSLQASRMALENHKSRSSKACTLQQCGDVASGKAKVDSPLKKLDRDMLQATSRAQQLQGLQSLRKMTEARPETFVQRILDAGLVPRLLHVLKGGDEPLQHEAASILINLAFGSAEQAQYLHEHNVTASLLELLRTPPSERVAEDAIWALTNMASTHRSYLLANGVLEPILKWVRWPPVHKEPTMIDTIVWCLRQLIRDELCCPPLLEALTVLLLHNTDRQNLVDALYVLSRLIVQGPVAETLLVRLLELLAHPEDQIIHRALNAINALLYYHNQLQAGLVRFGLLGRLRDILCTPTRFKLHDQACRTLYDVIFYDNAQIIRAVFASGLVTVLIRLVPAEPSDNWGCIEALASILMQATKQQILSVPLPSFNVLTCGTNDSLALGSVLKAAEHVRQLVPEKAIDVRHLMDHDNEEIALLATRIHS